MPPPEEERRELRLSAALWVPQKRWTPQEAWIWERVLAGEVADLEQRYGGTLEPRRVSEGFLLDVLTIPDFAEAVPHHGVRIIGAWFPEPLDLSDIVFRHQLWLERCRFDGKVSFRTVRLESHLSLEGSTFKGEVDLAGAKVDGQISALGATFEGSLDMSGLVAGQHLFLRSDKDISRTTFKGEVNLTATKVGGHLDARGAAFEARLHMEGLMVGQNLLLHSDKDSGRTTFEGEVVLLGARIEGQLAALGATFEGNLDMNGLAVGGDLFLSGGATFNGEVVLIAARVGGQLDASGATFEARLNLDGVAVGQNLFLRGGATFKDDVVLHRARVGGVIDVSDATFHGTLDASTAMVEGELRLGSSLHHRARWEPDASLVLRNTSVGALQDRIDQEPSGKLLIDKEPGGKLLDAWPELLQLEGFTYRRLGGLGGEGESEMIDRPASWYVGWLARDPSFSPQPYRQLANVFREAGADDQANAILYALRERERAEAWRRRAYLRWLSLGLLKLVIGYGIGAGYFWALAWAGLFTLIGTLVLWLGSTDAWLRGFGWCVFASLDEILPLVELNKAHAEFVDKTLAGGRQVYFYAHRIIGYLLGSFVVAGLAGLTQGR